MELLPDLTPPPSRIVKQTLTANTYKAGQFARGKTGYELLRTFQIGTICPVCPALNNLLIATL